MKKSIRVLLILALCILLSTSALASENTYELNDIDIKVTVPSEYLVVTRDTPETDPACEYLASMGQTKEEWLLESEETDEYLLGLTLNSEFNITCTPAGNEPGLRDMRKMTEESLSSSLRSISAGYSMNGMLVESSQIYRTKQAPFFMFQFGGAMPGIQFLTVFNENIICLNYIPYSGEISAESSNTMKTIVDSMEFIDDSDQNSAAVPIEAFNILGIAILAIAIFAAVVFLFPHKKKTTEQNNAGSNNNINY